MNKQHNHRLRMDISLINSLYNQETQIYIKLVIYSTWILLLLKHKTRLACIKAT